MFEPPVPGVEEGAVCSMVGVGQVAAEDAAGPARSLGPAQVGLGRQASPLPLALLADELAQHQPPASRSWSGSRAAAGSATPDRGAAADRGRTACQGAARPGLVRAETRDRQSRRMATIRLGRPRRTLPERGRSCLSPPRDATLLQTALIGLRSSRQPVVEAKQVGRRMTGRAGWPARARPGRGTRLKSPSPLASILQEALPCVEAEPRHPQAQGIEVLRRSPDVVFESRRGSGRRGSAGLALEQVLAHDVDGTSPR